MHTIKLPTGEWMYDDLSPLGPPGGFGEVFRGSGNGSDVAVKRLKLTARQAAHRELAIGLELQNRELNHVVPILDCGQDAESEGYYLVMPVCEKSLQDVLQEMPQGLGINDAIPIVQAVVAGLTEVADITHRDLKPGNILFHNGLWKIADFGIAKFVEDATSLESLRGWHTPPYAAPEQLRGERPTGATDVYSLGCIVHALLTGAPPFVGSIDEIRDGHLFRHPPAIEILPAGTSAFVTQMLRKTPAARPTLGRCAQVLGNVPLETKEATAGRIALSAAAKQVATEEAEKEARQQQQEKLRNDRVALIAEAEETLRCIFDDLSKEFLDVSPNAIGDGYSIELGRARLELSQQPHTFQGDLIRQATRAPTSWDIVLCAKLRISEKTGGPSSLQQGLRSASLIFAKNKLGQEGFRWYEVAFIGERWQAAGIAAPFGLSRDDGGDILLALSNVSHNVGTAYPPTPIDGEDQPRFVDRWLNWTSKAAIGQLRSPSVLPVNDPSSI